MHRLEEVVRLHRLGRSAREIARLCGMSRKTVLAYRAILIAADLWEGNPAELPNAELLHRAVAAAAPPRAPQQQPSTIDRWASQIELLASRGAGPTAIFDHLRLEHEDFAGSLSAVKRVCARIRRERGVQVDDVVIPVETRPGDVAQVDFGYVGKLYDNATGVMRKAWLFLMVLGHSRRMVGRIVFDQKVETWLQLHVECFRELDGAPQTLVPDNLKSAIVRTAFGVDRTAIVQRSYCELARHYGFQIDPTPPRSPKKKGKVERGVRYVRQNFLATREFADIHEARMALAEWLDEIANQRVHGTTGKRPIECFNIEEQQHLLPLPPTRFELVSWKRSTVHRDAHVVFDGAYYSVPWKHLGKQVDLRVTTTRVAIYLEHELLWNHDRVARGQRRTVESHLPPERACLRHRSRDFWEMKAERMGPHVVALVRAVFDSDDVLLQLRAVQAIVTHLDTFPRERANAAAARALHFGNLTYPGIKRILREGLDLQALPAEQQGVLRWPARPRFSRVPVPDDPDGHDRSTDSHAEEAPSLWCPADSGTPNAAGGG